MIMGEYDEKEENARTELIRLGSDNGMYFVVWRGHFGNHMVGVRNARDMKPEVYGAIFESYYDLVGDDEILFSYTVPEVDDESGRLFSWTELLSATMPYVLKAVAEKPGLGRRAADAQGDDI